MLKGQLMTVPELASYLRCSVTTVRRIVARGEIPHYRLGKMVRFRRREIDTWLTAYHEGEESPEARKVLVDPDQLSLFDAQDVVRFSAS